MLLCMLVSTSHFALQELSPTDSVDHRIWIASQLSLNVKCKPLCRAWMLGPCWKFEAHVRPSLGPIWGQLKPMLGASIAPLSQSAFFGPMSARGFSATSETLFSIPWGHFAALSSQSIKKTTSFLKLCSVHLRAPLAMAYRIGVLPAVLLFFGAWLTFSAANLRSPRSLRGFRCGPLQVAKVQAALPPEELEDFASQGIKGIRGNDQASSHGFHKTQSVGQLLLLDCALLAAAFFINLKCARKLQGVVIPESFLGRMFLWI